MENNRGKTVSSEGGGRDVKYQGNLAFAVVVAGRLGTLEGAGPWIMDTKTVAAIQVGSPRENDHCKYPCVIGQPRPARSWGKPLRTGGCILTRRCRTKMPIPQLTGLCFSNLVDGLDE
jgi:hypothetical protein